MTKRQRIWLIAGAVASAIAVACCAGVVALVLWFNQDGPDDVVNDYLTAVREDDISAARDLTCGSLSQDIITDMLTDSVDIVDWDVEETERHERSAEVTVRITYRAFGQTQSNRARFLLVEEDGDWRVCGFRDAT